LGWGSDRTDSGEGWIERTSWGGSGMAGRELSAESVTFRRAEVGDGAAVAAVFGTARSEMAYLPALHTPDEDRAFFTDRVVGSGLHDVTVAVAEMSSWSEMVGFCAVHAGWIEHLYVTPAWQGAGIGSALLARAMSENPGGLSLWVFEQNERAAALYSRSGFVVVERTDGLGNEEQVPDLRMQWSGPLSAQG
jgi:GNAT superfamily N-acetyltransferase